MKMPNFIEGFLNKTPMYKLVILVLISISVVAFIESGIGLQPYSIIGMLESLALSLVVCLGLNFVMAKILKLPVQYESSIITSLILFLVISPAQDTTSVYAIIIAAILATLSKYILVYRNTHIFNPAAFGIYSATLLYGASLWWVGSLYLLPIVVVLGYLIVHKTRREAMFFTGLALSLLGTVVSSYMFSMNFFQVFNYTFLSGPIVFFLAIMVTEPHTIAKNKFQQIIYTALIVLLPVPFTMMGKGNVPPELSLLIANIVSFIISKRTRYALVLESINKLSDDIFEYNFKNAGNNSNFYFRAGEFMEWELDHPHSDDRGLRRYFTISSAPNSPLLSFATKFAGGHDSTFKQQLKNIRIGDAIFASQLGGDFLLPDNNKKNIIMIAGGIGITPFISQIRDLLKRKEKRSLVIFYAVRFPKDIVYVEELKRAVDELGAKVVCVISEPATTPGGRWDNWFYETGLMSREILQKYTQNLHNVYYISGPNIMVSLLKKTLHDMKVAQKDIHTDYFPGY